jgi:hypothetical protein
MVKKVNQDPTVTVGISSKGNTQALTMCLTSVLTSSVLPLAIQVRLEGDPSGCSNFYFEQLASLASLRGVAFQFSVFKSTGVRDSRDWQVSNCQTPWLWMLDDDVVVDHLCLEAYQEASYPLGADLGFFAGSKPDVNNRRNYPVFDTTPVTKEVFLMTSNHNHNLIYRPSEFLGVSAPAEVLDTGNCILNVQKIKEVGIKFRQFPDQFNPSGDATTVSLALNKAGLKGFFVPAAVAYHLEKPNGGFNEFEARGEMLLRLCEVKGYDKSILKNWMPGVKRNFE